MRPEKRASTWIASGVALVALVSSAACSSFSGDDGADADAGGVDAGGGDAGGPGDPPATDGAAGDAGPRDAGPGLIAFVTSAGYADVTTTATADTKCTADADGRLPGRFVAWLSSATVAAPDRLIDSKSVPVDGPWFRVDGLRIAASRTALLGTASIPLENPIKLTATGKVAAGGVWTGTHADGTIGTLCPLGVSPTSGAADQVGPAWTDQTFFTPICGSTSLALYCFQVE